MDIQNYIDRNIIGANNVEVDCTQWEFMKSTSTDLWNAYLTGLNEAIMSNSRFLDYNITSERQGLDLFLYRLNNSIRNYQLTRDIFYNSLICTPLDIVDSIRIPSYSSKLNVDSDWAEVQTVQIERIFVNVPIDYTGKTTFIEQYYTDFQAAQVEMSETLKDFLKFFYKATEASLTTPATPFNGTC